MECTRKEFSVYSFNLSVNLICSKIKCLKIHEKMLLLKIIYPLSKFRELLTDTKMNLTSNFLFFKKYFIMLNLMGHFTLHHFSSTKFSFLTLIINSDPLDLFLLHSLSLFFCLPYFLSLLSLYSFLIFLLHFE